MTSSWPAHPLLASPGQYAAPWSDTVVQRQGRGGSSRGSALGPCDEGPAQASTSPAVANGSEEPQVADPRPAWNPVTLVVVRRLMRSLGSTEKSPRASVVPWLPSEIEPSADGYSRNAAQQGRPNR